MQLVYAINSPIPVWIVVKSDDVQALDLLATTAALPIRLRRCLAVGEDAYDNLRVERQDGTSFSANCGNAVMWPLQNQSEPPAIDAPQDQSNTLRILEGEIYVTSSVKPSFVFTKVALRVSYFS